MKTRKQGRFQEPIPDQIDDDVMEEVFIDQPKEEKATDVKARGKGTTVRQPRAPPAPKLSQTLKESTDSQAILSRILDGNVNLSLKELIGLSPRLHRSFFTGLDPNSPLVESNAKPTTQAVVRNVAVDTNNLQMLPKSLPIEDDAKALYVSKTLRTVVSVGDVGLRAIIDTGAEINLITEEMADYLDLPIRPNPTISVVLQTNDQVECVGCCEDVPVRIGDIIIHIPMMVVQGGLDFILGRPWQELAGWGCQTLRDGRVNCWIYDPERKRCMTFEAYVPDQDEK
ncbi:hypothetical protein KEM55_001657 [Ascosphaera atra]|nr:hypothetical protein KEM55_001657 [Ascosphaera atra]